MSLVCISTLKSFLSSGSNLMPLLNSTIWSGSTACVATVPSKSLISLLILCQFTLRRQKWKAWLTSCPPLHSITIYPAQCKEKQSIKPVRSVTPCLIHSQSTKFALFRFTHIKHAWKQGQWCFITQYRKCKSHFYGQNLTTISQKSYHLSLLIYRM